MQPFTGKSLLALNNPSTSIQAYEGAVRSGKTITSLIDWVRFIRQAPPGNLLMTGRTERTVVNNLLLPLQEMFGPSRVKITISGGTVTIMGRKVLIIGANNEAARTKIQGLTLVGAYVDEASTLPESYFKMLYTRLSVEGAKLWLTANPEGPSHWLKKDWLDKAKLWIDAQGKFHRNDAEDALDLHRYTFLIDDNKSLPAAYVERQKRSYKGLFYRRYILAEWVAGDGAVYDMWNPDKHVVPFEKLPPMVRIISVGIDYGTQHPTVAVALGLGYDRRLYLLDELRLEPPNDAERFNDAKQSALIKAWIAEDHTPEKQGLKPEWIIADQAGLSLRTQLKDDGVTTQAANKSVLYGISTLSWLLGEGQLFVSDRCPGVIKEITGYSWDPTAAAKGEDKPLKTGDDGLDAMRYAVVTTESIWQSELISSRARAGF
jgi:PBSX family phage terminase large subunit